MPRRAMLGDYVRAHRPCQVRWAGVKPKGEAMIVEATQAQIRSILGAMCRVAAPPSPADRGAIQAAYRYVFRGIDPLDVDALTPTSPEELARALPDPGLAQSAVRFLAVMALVDGRLDHGKIALVERYASALGIHEHYLRQLAEAAAGHLDWVGRDMMRQNVRSIPGLAWNPADVTAIFLPYAGAHADPARPGEHREGSAGFEAGDGRN
jgi:hypothetical protein